MSAMKTLQTPLNTLFAPKTTASEVADGIDLSGRTAVVTGGASGIGREIARVLSARGARVVVPARNLASARTSLNGISGVDVVPVDLLDAASLNRFASDVAKSGTRVDLLVLSAGVMAPPLFRDANGREGQFAVNHLGHFRLTAMLWPALLAAEGARIVVLSSRGHQIAAVDFDDIDFDKRGYDKWLAYGQSKTANALFAVSLDERGRRHGVRAYSVHPGSILTPLARHLSREELDGFGAIASDGSPVIDPWRDMKTVEQGAATAVWCAVADELGNVGGVYCEDCDIAPVESAGRFGVRPYAIDPTSADKLWKLSASLTGTDIAPGG